MRLSTKHANQQPYEYRDFSGGLNVTNAEEMIQPTELSRAVNVEIDSGTGLLQTVAGTKKVFEDTEKEFFSFGYDGINDHFILVDSQKNVYFLDNGELVLAGALSGTRVPIYAEWEDGVLIASGGKLQYLHDRKLETITSSFADDIASWQEVNPSVWATGTTYALNDVVTNDNTYYKCTAAHTASSAFVGDKDKWQELTLKTWTYSTAYVETDITNVEDKYYLCSTAHTSVSDSPIANGVFVTHGRVLVFYGDELKFSGIGDEHNWTNNTNDESSSQWLQVGYKDGGQIIGVCNMSADVLIVKDNGHAYHLAGQYPGWQLNEIGRNIDCKSNTSYCSLVNNALILGKSALQLVTCTNDYGDMRADNLATKVGLMLAELPPETRLRFLPDLNQVWMLTGENKFLFFDTNFKSFFQREYNRPVIDVICAGGGTYLLKSNGIYILSGDPSMLDDGDVLRWQFRCKTLVSYNNYLIKRVRVDITPFFINHADVRFHIGDLTVKGTLPRSANCVYHYYDGIYHNITEIFDNHSGPVYDNSDPVYDNSDYIFKNNMYLKSLNCFRTDERCVNRKRSIKVSGKGNGGRLLFNLISFDIAEV